MALASAHHPRRRRSSVTDPALLVPAIGQSFVKLDPRALVRNPVMFVVEIGAVMTTYAFIAGIVGNASDTSFVGQIALDVQHGRQPMDGISPAPPEYWRAFENASRLLDRQPFRMPTSVQAMASAADLRVADAFRIAA